MTSRRVSARAVADAVPAAAAVMGLAGLAITQPLLDLFGRSPEFFVAGKYDPSQIVAFGVVVALAPTVVALGISGIGWIIHPALGRIVYRAVLGAGALLLGLVVLGTVGIDVVWLALPIATAWAGVVLWMVCRWSPVRSLLSYLALGNVAFLGLFLFASPTADLVTSRSAAGTPGSVRVPPLPGPVVFVILDEFPVTTLMRSDGTLNEERFPRIAELAQSATWFRNASSHDSMTSESVPSILTGRLSTGGDLPTYADHPNNYFTLFGDRYPVNRYESVTDLCPPEVCDPVPGLSLDVALRDAAVVYGHQVLPGWMKDALPAIDHSWGAFGDHLKTESGDVEDEVGASAEASEVSDVPAGYERWHGLDAFDRSALGQSRILDETGSLIDASPSVNLIHVALPHYPWSLTPWGSRLTRFPYELTSDPDDPGYRSAAIQRYQLHSLQAGAADASVGRLVDHLRQADAWDDALVVVTSDHGTSLLPPDFGRTVTRDNREEVLRVPLFIKAPGQRAGEIRDEVAQSIDILPSIIDLLDVQTDWTFDGHSLYDGSEPTVEPRVDRDVASAVEVAARHARDFPHGDDWAGLAAIGEDGWLVGTQVANSTVGEPSTLRWSPDDGHLFGSLPTDDGRIPYMLSGTVSAEGDERPPDLLVAINGTFAGQVGAYQRDEGRWRFTGVMGPFFRTGANEVTAYEVESGSEGPVLHPVVRR